MKLWQDLFGTDYGLMSIAGIAFMIFMAVLYGCLPAMSSNPHRCVKKSAAALYPACGMGAGLPLRPTGPDVIR